MSENPSDSAEHGVPSADDTAAFQRFYFEEAPKTPSRSLAYRVLVGWWRHRS